MEHKTTKVLDMTVDGIHIFCIFHYDEKTNPYHLFLSWYGYKDSEHCGRHRKQVARYQNFISVIEHIRNYMHVNHKGFTDVF